MFRIIYYFSLKDPEINHAVLNIQQNTNIQTSKAFLFSLDKYQQGKDSNLDEFVENFKVFQICSEGIFLYYLLKY